MREDPDPLAVIVEADIAEQAADPQRHVTPAFSTWRPVVELPDMLAALGLGGEAVGDPDSRHRVEHTQLSLAKPLVEHHRQIQRGPVDGEAGGVGRTPVGRAEHDSGTLSLLEGRDVTGQALDLQEAGLGELDVRVAEVQLEPASPERASLAVGDIPQALCMADKHQLSRSLPACPTARGDGSADALWAVVHASTLPIGGPR